MMIHEEQDDDVKPRRGWLTTMTTVSYFGQPAESSSRIIWHSEQSGQHSMATQSLQIDPCQTQTHHQSCISVIIIIIIFIISIIIIIIINEKINVAFSRRTARTRNSHKKTQAAKTSCLTVQKSSVFSCRLNISNNGCDVSVAGKLFHTVYLVSKVE